MMMMPPADRFGDHVDGRCPVPKTERAVAVVVVQAPSQMCFVHFVFGDVWMAVWFVASPRKWMCSSVVYFEVMSTGGRESQGGRGRRRPRGGRAVVVIRSQNRVGRRPCRASRLAG